jgi:hypothetical protein
MYICVSAEDSTILDRSKLGDLLGQFVNVLIVEEGENRDKSEPVTWPCFDHFVAESMFEKLCGFGLSDVRVIFVFSSHFVLRGAK